MLFIDADLLSLVGHIFLCMSIFEANHSPGMPYLVGGLIHLLPEI